MASLFTLLNRLLPFATPGTPLLQDLVHLGALCLLLYLGPRIQERLRARSATHQTTADNVLNEQQAIDNDQDPHQNDPIPEPIDHNPPFNNDPGPAPAEQNWNNDERPLAQQQEQQEQQQLRNIPNNPNRNVGAKKAKSLARKDQRRAYHEFQRAQGEAQRARDAEGAQEREAALAAERERRQAAEEAMARKKAEERERRRVKEEREREEEQRRRERVVAIVREGLSDEGPGRVDLFEVARAVGEDADEQWVERIVEGSGVLDVKGEGVRFITGTGWAVRMSRETMLRVYEQALRSDVQQLEHHQLADLLIAVQSR